MSIFLPLAFSSLGYGFQAYKSTRIQVPIGEMSPFGFTEIFVKGSDEYKQAIEKLPGAEIKRELQPFLDQERIRRDLLIIEQLNLGICSAAGTNYFARGDAAIFIDPNFHAIDKQACHWVTKHEISHIKNNDSFTIPLVSLVCVVVAAIFTAHLLSTVAAICMTVAIGMIAQIAWTQYCERRADYFAIANSSMEELKGGRRLLIATRQAALEGRTTKSKRILISARGEFRLDLCHPSITSRIQKIEQALQKNQVVLDDAAEKPKIEKLKKHLVQTISRIEDETTKLGFFGLLKAYYS